MFKFLRTLNQSYFIDLEIYFMTHKSGYILNYTKINQIEINQYIYTVNLCISVSSVPSVQRTSI